METVKHLAFLACLLLCGCRIEQPVGPLPPGPVTPDVQTTGWAQLSHDATVNAARAKAAILREAASKRWNSIDEKSAWVNEQLKTQEAACYLPIKQALAKEFGKDAENWSEARHAQIDLESASGYEAVR